MDDHPILGKQTKPPVDQVIKQYYILIRLYSMEPQLGLKGFFPLLHIPLQYGCQVHTTDLKNMLVQENHWNVVAFSVQHTVY